MQHLPIAQQCTDAEAKILKRVYETKLKKYYHTVDAVNQLIKFNINIIFIN